MRGLDSHNIVDVACGEYHSVAVNEWGQVFSWGSNSYGQLGTYTAIICISTVESVSGKREERKMSC